MVFFSAAWLKTLPWNVYLGCRFGTLHKSSSFLVAADHSGMGGISSTILENHSALSELTLRFLTENRPALYEFSMLGLLLSTSEQWQFSVKRIQHDKFQLQQETRGNV